MLVERTFWPVGHGGFFTEQLLHGDNPTTVVYDCGTKKAAKICEKQINAFINQRFHRKPAIIDLLFITHFDEDHVKCIAYLANMANIRNIVIPYFDDYDLLYLQYSNHCPSLTSTDIRSALKLPDSTNIYRVVPQDDKMNIDFWQDFVRISIDTDVDHSSGIDTAVPPDTQFNSQYYPNWVWHVFNYDRPNNTPHIRAMIQQLLIDKGQSPTDLHYLIDNFSSLKKELRRIYGDPVERNNGSLVIFSGPFSKPVRTSSAILRLCAPSHLHIYFEAAPGFVYMGDYNANETVRLDAYLDFIKPHINHFSGLQVPHHGSGNNFSPKILKNTYWSIVAVPENNRNGHHPHIDVWSEMRLNGFAFKVTENEDTLLEQHCHCLF